MQVIGQKGTFFKGLKKGRKKWIPSVWRIDQQKNRALAFGCRQKSFNASFVSATMIARLAVLTEP